ncbi:BspA family leucine-rich repeat surface protein [Dyadobacter sp. CY326]|uniref:BspA family leucine-rich repeat surface protein n=1 Tax=Dyadobacter sp. CY326 TaxID=2907300 RepID=UPI0038D41FBD
MSGMFSNCTALMGAANISNSNTANVVDMSTMFMFATAQILYLSRYFCQKS